MPDLTRHYLISGRVQGVGFRAFAHRVAKALHLSGWVRNLRDGRVEALVSGSAEKLAEWESQVRQGPGRAIVDAFLVREFATAKSSGEFDVQPDGSEPWKE
ncbi:MAG: acylphosphatase [Bdellovibrionales bacterium]